jgi:glycosyltransferase involved in cell wall biosynthesis
MNILLAAYACEPNRGSEPEVGWQLVCALARSMPENTFYAVTKANNRSSIEKLQYPENVVFFYYDLPKSISFWKKGGRGIRTYYYLWMIGAVIYVKKKKIAFDIIHHITFVNDWLPSFFCFLKNKNSKFVWGPIGSHDPIAPKFLFGARRNVTEKVRILLQKFFRSCDPFFYYCKEHADCIIGINDNVKNKLALANNRNFVSEPAIAISQDAAVNLVSKKKVDKKFRVISVGRLLYIKNFRLTLFAFSIFLKSQNDKSKFVLQIVGTGRDLRDLQIYAEELGISGAVEFVGQISRQEVQRYLSEAHVFLFPTLENAGFVTLEAMSNSLPVVALKYGGPEQFIKHNTCEQLVLIEPSFQLIAKSLADRLHVLYSDESLREKIGSRNKLATMEDFTWSAKAQKIKNIYEALYFGN